MSVDLPSILSALNKASLVRLGRVFDVHVDAGVRKEDQVRVLTTALVYLWPVG